jgi:hypothetical protein
MALVPISPNSTPSFIALSTDIDRDNKIEGASLYGKLVFTTDDGNWYIIEKDLTLSPYTLPISLNTDVEIGAVEIKDATGTNRVTVTSNGELTITGNIGRAATEVSPTAQVSTNTFVLVTNSILDTLHNLSASFTIKNTGTNTINWKVIAGNTSNLSDAVEVKASAAVASSAVDSYSTSAAVWRYYGVYIQSAVADTPGEATVHGITKG